MISPSNSSTSPEFKFDKELLNNKFGAVTTDFKGGQQRTPAFEVIQKAINKASNALSNFNKVSKEPKSANLRDYRMKHELNELGEGFSEVGEGLNAIKSELSKLESPDKTAVQIGINSLRERALQISEQINALSKQIHGNFSGSYDEKLDGLKDCKKTLDRLMTQILYSKVIKDLFIEEIKSNVETTHIAILDWLGPLGRIIEKMLRFFIPGEKSVVTSDQLTEEYAACTKSLGALQTASFDLNNTKEVQLFKDAVRKTRENLKKFGEHLKSGSPNNSEFDGGLKFLEDNLGILEAKLDAFQKTFDQGKAVKALELYNYANENTGRILQPEKMAETIISLLEEADDKGELFKWDDVKPAIIWAKEKMEEKQREIEVATKNQTISSEDDEYQLLSLCIAGADELVEKYEPTEQPVEVKPVPVDPVVPKKVDTISREFQANLDGIGYVINVLNNKNRFDRGDLILTEETIKFALDFKVASSSKLEQAAMKEKINSLTTILDDIKNFINDQNQDSY